MLKLNKILIALMVFAFGFSLTAEAQVSAGAITTRASSQLILWYDEEDLGVPGVRNSFLQISNTSDTTPVEIHVQIYSSTGDAITVNNTVRCIEADFNDVLTANDTHIYIMDDIRLNQGELGTQAPVPSVEGTKGFVVITPVVGSGDNTAISFQNMIGTSFIEQSNGWAYKVSAAGRDAVDLATGNLLADGTALDGVSTGFFLIQPDEIVFNVTNGSSIGIDTFDEVDIVAIVFNDEYGPAGLLGYRAVPGESTFSPFLFNFEEVPASCPIATNQCFNNWGLNSQLPAENQLIDPGINVCDAVTLGTQSDGAISGWSRFFVNSISPGGNQLVLIGHTASSLASAEWSHVVGPPIPIPPPDECSNLPAECGNPVCKPLPGCENPDGVDPDGVNFCQDGVDNDGVNGTDCQDFGCDGFVAITTEEGVPTGPCESAGETSCADEFDNDANGFVDCGLIGGEPDPNCVAIGACGDDDDDDDDGGNCSLAGPVATGTAAANFLLPLLPLAGAYALRRIRRRNNK